MFRIASRPVRALSVRTCRQPRSFHSTSKFLDTEKLRILFCGADRFSVAHLHALQAEASLPDSSIASIDVVTRTDKRHGRGSTSIVSPPVKATAIQLGLPLHQLDTFSGWQPPPTDLIVAVSFGLLVPARILQSSRYGGINVHPSLLPDLRGAAPVHWAIMLGRKHTGVTIQSLHPTKFDEGVIIAQTPPPGVPINGRYSGLQDTLAAFGCSMLIDVIRVQSYRPPYKALQPRDFDEVALAPKIAQEHRILDFDSLTAEDIIRRMNAIGKLYAYAQDDSGTKRRVILTSFLGIYTPLDPEIGAICRWQPVGQPYMIQGRDGTYVGSNVHNSSDNHSAMFINTVDGKTIYVQKMIVEGFSLTDCVTASRRARLVGPLRRQPGFHNFSVQWFYAPLSPGPLGGHPSSTAT